VFPTVTRTIEGAVTALKTQTLLFILNSADCVEDVVRESEPWREKPTIDKSKLRIYARRTPEDQK